MCTIASAAWAMRCHLTTDGLFRVSSGSHHTEAVLLAAIPSDHVSVVAATACVVPFLLDPATALGRRLPWPLMLQCLALIAFLLDLSSAVCTRRPLSASWRRRWHAIAFLLGPPSTRSCSDCSSVLLLPQHNYLRLRPVLQMSIPVHRGTVADARLGLA